MGNSVIAPHVCNPRLVGVGDRRVIEVAGRQPNLRFSEKVYLKGVRQILIEQDSVLLWSYSHHMHVCS